MISDNVLEFQYVMQQERWISQIWNMKYWQKDIIVCIMNV